MPQLLELPRPPEQLHTLKWRGLPGPAVVQRKLRPLFGSNIKEEVTGSCSAPQPPKSKYFTPFMGVDTYRPPPLAGWKLTGYRRDDRVPSAVGLVVGENAPQAGAPEVRQCLC